MVDVAESSAAKELVHEADVPFFPSLDDLLREPGAEAIDICTPSGLHAEQAIQAMQAERHVLVEKPMALSRQDCDRMLAAQGGAGVKLGVVSQHRFDPSIQYLSRLIKEGDLGTLILGTALVPWHRTQAYYDQAPWRGTRAMDGGVFLNQAIHCVDLLLYFLGKAVSVSGYARTVTHSMESEDLGVMSIEFESGALATLAATTAAFPERDPRIEIIGTDGSAVIEGDRLTYLSSRSGAQPYLKRSEDWLFSSSHAAQIADFLASIREDRAPVVDGIAGRRAVEVIMAALESEEKGDHVALS